MFKKSSNLIHLHDRTGSHATKGGARGTPWFAQLSDVEKETIIARRECMSIKRQINDLRVIRKRAKNKGENKIAKECAQAIRRLLKLGSHIARSKGIDQIKIRW